MADFGVDGFQAAIDRNLEGMCGVAITDTEPSFAWHKCDSCGSRFGGDRFDAIAWDINGEEYELSICVDCTAWHANGELPEDWAPHPGDLEYRDVTIRRVQHSGMWSALTPLGYVKADTLDGIRELIDDALDNIIVEIPA